MGEYDLRPRVYGNLIRMYSNHTAGALYLNGILRWSAGVSVGGYLGHVSASMEASA